MAHSGWSPRCANWSWPDREPAGSPRRPDPRRRQRRCRGHPPRRDRRPGRGTRRGRDLSCASGGRPRRLKPGDGPNRSSAGCTGDRTVLHRYVWRARHPYSIPTSWPHGVPARRPRRSGSRQKTLQLLGIRDDATRAGIPRNPLDVSLDPEAEGSIPSPPADRHPVAPLPGREPDSNHRYTSSSGPQFPPRKHRSGNLYV